MCFYRDTQAALERNNLHNLLKQRKNAPSKDSTRHFEKLEDQIYSEPYKKLHIRMRTQHFPWNFILNPLTLAKKLYQDLLLLSGGDACTNEESTTGVSPTQEDSADLRDVKEEVLSPIIVENADITKLPRVGSNNLQNDDLLNLLRNTSIKGNYENRAEFSFFESLTSIIEKNNSIFKSVLATQVSLCSELQTCKNFAKTVEYCLLAFTMTLI